VKALVAWLSTQCVHVMVDVVRKAGGVLLVREFWCQAVLLKVMLHTDFIKEYNTIRKSCNRINRDIFHCCSTRFCHGELMEHC